MSASSRLLNLPLELVTEIVKHVDRPDPPWQSTLAALNRTSRLFNSLTTWRLYRAPRYRYSKWPTFARTLMTRKDLAAHVKDLYFHGPLFDDLVDPDTFPEEVAAYYLEHYDDQLLHDEDRPHYPLQDDPMSDKPSLFTAEEDQQTNAYIEMAVILNLCSETVETILVNVDLCWEGFNIIPSPASLPVLTNLAIVYADAVDGWGSEYEVLKSLVCAASNLTTLVLSRACYFPPLSTLEKLTHLVLNKAGFSVLALSEMLQYMPNLESFEYQFASTYDIEWQQIHPREALDAITTHCTRLKSFCMDATLDHSGDLDFIDDSQVEDIKQSFVSKGIEFTFLR